MKNLLLGAFYLSLASSIWGGLFIAVRLSVTTIPPIPLVWCRYAIALPAIYLIGHLARVSWHIDKADWGRLLVAVLTGYVLSIVTQETGTMLTSAQTGAVVTSATPAFMVIFGIILLKERLTLLRIASVIVATVGVLLVVLDPENLQADWLGGLSLIIAALTWALMSVILKLLNKYSVIVLTFYGILSGVACLAPYALWWLTTMADWTAILSQPAVWGSVLYMGVISTTLGFCLWNKGLLYMDAAIGGLFLFFQPIVGTFFGWLLLGEAITKYFWAGFALIAIGVIMAIIKNGSTSQ